MTELPDQSLESLTPADEPGASPLALAAIVGGITATLLGWTPLRVWSIWWHLAMGRLIDHFSAVPVANHTLYTMPERAPSWVQAWLGQRLLFWSHEALGIEGVLTTRALLFGAAMALAVRLGIGRSATTWQGLGYAALGLAIAWWGMVTTPVMYVAPVFVLLVFLACQGDLADGWKRTARDALCFGASAALWANVDSACWWPAALASCGLLRAWGMRARVGRAWLGWCVVVAMSLAALMINPRGPALLGHIWQQWSANPGTTHAEGWSHVVPWGSWHGACVLVGVLVGAASLWRSNVREPARWALCVLASALGFWIESGALWLGLALPVIMSSNTRTAQATRGSLRWWVVAGVCLLFGALSQPLWSFHSTTARHIPGTRQHQPHAGVISAEVPLEPVELLRRHYTTAPHVFHAPEHGGYVLWRLMRPEQPLQLVYNDARADLLSPRLWQDQDAALHHATGWDRLAQLYRLDAALLKRREHAPLISHLKRAGWYVAHEDDRHALLLRRT